MIKRRFETLGDLEKLFHMFLNNIDYEILVQGKMRSEKGFKSYLNNQSLWY